MPPTRTRTTGHDRFRLRAGLALHDTRITAPVHCAPPQNRPTHQERRTCSPYLARELELLSQTLQVIVVLGGFGWQALLASLADTGWALPDRFRSSATELRRPSATRTVAP